MLIISCCYNANAASSGFNTPANPTITPSKIDGVNFGGIFVLEDWFFSKSTVGHNVGTTCAEKTGVASASIFTGDSSVDFMWTSETDLVQKLESKYTPNQVINFFKAHRAKYMSGGVVNGISDPTLSSSFAKVQSLGIGIVRLPITWAIQYNTPYTIIGTNGSLTIPAFDQANPVQLIKDPFYPNAKWVSIPINQIESILTEASRHNIKVILDIHSFPGGAGDGTYNGVWPLAPKFWSVNKDIYQQNFQTIFTKLLTWAKDLQKTDLQAFNAIEGFTPMNEPAHLMGFLDISAKEAEQNKVVCSATGKTPSWGPSSYADILATLTLAIDDFRTFKKSLSKDIPNDTKLYLNVIETMFDPTKPSEQKIF